MVLVLQNVRASTSNGLAMQKYIEVFKYSAKFAVAWKYSSLILQVFYFHELSYMIVKEWISFLYLDSCFVPFQSPYTCESRELVGEVMCLIIIHQ